MLKTIMSKILNNKKAATGFHDLSSSEQKKIIKKAARGANKDQKMLVKEYETKFGHPFDKCRAVAK